MAIVAPTIPLPLELIYETLDYCSPNDVWQFAKTSRSSFDRCFLILLSKYRHVTFPNAIHDGLIEKHKYNGIFEKTENITVDISRNSCDGFWQKSSRITALKLLDEFPNLRCIRIISSNEDCDIELLLQLFKWLYTTKSRISEINIDLNINHRHQSLLQSHINDFLNKSTSQSPPITNSLTTLSISITSSSSRSILKSLLPILSPLTKKIQELSIIIKWTSPIQIPNSTKHKPIDFSPVASDSITYLTIQDKYWMDLEVLSHQISEIWPNVEDLIIDGGVANDMTSLLPLSHLQNLTNLTTFYPYSSLTPQSPDTDTDTDTIPEQAYELMLHHNIQTKFKYLKKITWKYLSKYNQNITNVCEFWLDFHEDAVYDGFIVGGREWEEESDWVDGFVLREMLVLV